MKALLFLPFLLCGSLLAEPAAPPAEKPEVTEKVIAKYPKLETKERYTFVDVQVLEKVPDGIYIRHKEGKAPAKTTFTLLQYGGLTFLPYESLPDAVRKELGGFPAPEARKFREKREADDKEGNRHPLTGKQGFIAYDPVRDRKPIP
ncbi:hypothetical protein OKA05_27205 [Luteolibacter arcticus]|uniref:DUF2782 domain-containing protein n=1 Tax=Luteolibacter arcticus TaxID=1581411 RepID=A0ABT3GS10_9BACT|nr:hypothetical protein [Luteolibacter arcticus]MCW1926272.1 hypothetical protein [Luteolibacter arcticus]